LLANADPIIQQPTLMIYGNKDVIPKFEGLSAFAPNVEEVSLDCGHWIQQEKPQEIEHDGNLTHWDDYKWCEIPCDR